MADLWGRNGGPYLGFACDSCEGPPPKLRSHDELHYVGERHIVTTGATGSGKTRKLFFPNVHDLTDWSKVICDPRGTLFKMTHAHLERAGCINVVADPYNITGQSTGLDPLSALNPKDQDNFPDDAMALAEALVKAEGKEPHWGQSGQEAVAALAMYWRLMGGTLADVRACLGMNDADIRSLVKSKEFIYKGKSQLGMIAAGIEHEWEEIGTKAARFGDISHENRELHSILSTAITQTRWLDSRAIKRDISKGSFDFTLLKRRPVNVFLILPARRISTHGGWLRMAVSTILQALMADMSPSKVPIMFMLDEFYAFARGDGMPIVADNMAMFREFGIKLWIALQDLPQIQELYDKRWQSFLGNAGILQSFAPQDTTTSEHLSKLAGVKTVAATSGSDSISRGSGGGSGSASTSYNQVKVPVMLEQEIRGMGNGFTLVFSDKAKGAIRSYCPYPGLVSRWRDACKLDPSNG